MRSRNRQKTLENYSHRLIPPSPKIHTTPLPGRKADNNKNKC